MSKSLVIVESPTKARTIEKYLGKDYEVLASYGHVRDLPNNAAEIPPEIKKQKWSRLGINIENDFEPLYIIPEEKKKRVNELKKSLKDAKEVLLATDEDREGESISWHLLEVLKPKVPVKRMVFHEITREAIDESLKNPRTVDQNLVKAQETRRLIDRLFGYSVSPLLWKKMAPRLSAGRVQSVAMRLLVERERERIRFRVAQYWDLKALLKKLAANGNEKVEAELAQVAGKKIAIGKDFGPETGKLLEGSEALHLDQAGADALRSRLLGKTPVVTSVEEKPYSSKPYAPFTTSTMQQEASRKLGYSARRTMQVAQALYENGVITYMRTDSTTLSEEALKASRELIEREFGKEYLYPEARVYKTKVRNAQEAHEAVRPAGAAFVSPSEVKQKYGDEAFRLYELIWKRTIASQMKDSNGTRVTVEITIDDAIFKATGRTITFPGYLRAYVEGSDDPEADLADREKILPRLSVGEKLEIESLEAISHETQPPPRYTEGSLIKELERLGIGRPSTWATIVDVVLSRDYAFKRGQALVPTFLATALTNLMELHFTTLMNYEFTAHLEDDLDAISRGEAQNLDYLKKFYFGNGHPGLKTLVDQGQETIDPRLVCGIPLGHDPTGRLVEVRIGRFGPFLSNGEHRMSVPDDIAPEEMTLEKAQGLLEDAAKGPTVLGTHPETQLPIYFKKGRFGPYIQMGDQVEDGPKPKMVSLLPGMTAQDVNFEVSIKLLEFPKNIGTHPELNQEVMVFTGRYGPYIKCGEETRSIPTDDISPLTITLEQAIELLKQPKRRGRTSQPKQLRELGAHPDSGAKIVMKSGRYGPYVTDGTLNASLPRNADPEALTLQEALNLLAERAAKAPMKKQRGAKKAKPAAKAEKPAKAKAAKKKKAPKSEEEAANAP